MRRTRRIEIVKYTRRVTVSEGGNAPADSDERPPIDLNLVAPRGADMLAPSAEATETQGLRPRAWRLLDLLRLRR